MIKPLNINKLLQLSGVPSCCKYREGNHLRGRQIPCHYGWEESCLKSLPFFVSIIHMATVKAAFQGLH